jgi:diguanylate cyclase (GGDEF)-like protein/PAS domain S-box-containing protein
VNGAPVGADTWAGDDPGELLSTVLGAVQASTGRAVHVVEPVTGRDGAIDDFTVVVDTGLLARLAGRPALGRRLRELFPREFAEELVSQYRQAFESGVVTARDFVIATDDDDVPVPAMGADEDRGRIGVVARIPVGGRLVALGHEVTEARRATHRLAASEARYRRLLDKSTDIVLVIDAAGTITYASPAVSTIVGAPPESVVGQRWGHYGHPEDAHLAFELVTRVTSRPQGTSDTVILRLVDTAGDVRWVTMTATNWLGAPNVDGVVINLRDITTEHLATQRLREEALQDALTGLPNRRWFMDALEHAAANSARTGTQFGLLLVDVDDFKAINDQLGHSAGDALLVELAQRLKTAVRPSDMVARLGGDEFVVIAQDVDGAPGADVLAHRIGQLAHRPYTLAGRSQTVTVSVGVTVSGHATTAHGGRPQVVLADMLRHADEALYEAKRGGRDRVEVFNPPKGNSTQAPG